MKTIHFVATFQLWIPFHAPARPALQIIAISKRKKNTCLYKIVLLKMFSCDERIYGSLFSEKSF